MRVDALAIVGEDRIEEAQEQLGVGIVVRGDRPLVGIDLTEQGRLDEAPSGDERMVVVHGFAKPERLQHVALEIDVAGEIGLRDLGFVERLQRPHGALITQAHFELRLAIAELAFLPARQLDREGRGKATEMLQYEIKCARAGRHSYSPHAVAETASTGP